MKRRHAIFITRVVLEFTNATLAVQFMHDARSIGMRAGIKFDVEGDQVILQVPRSFNASQAMTEILSLESSNG